ncbi:hypothetical protein MGN70_011558 [Eutypa lata]|nr:hypothetical protein MGN70_011558 [Eutypa lata]
MTDAPRDSGVSLSAFFDRCKLPSSVKEECDAFVKSKFPGDDCRPCPFQGYCSYTVRVGDETIVQFRPVAYRLDLDVVGTACRVFGTFAPETCDLGEIGQTGLHVYSMRRLPGVSLLDLRADHNALTRKSKRENIIKDFAHIQAMSWRQAKASNDVTVKRTVGSSLGWRLQLMATHLPRRFQQIVKSVLADLPDIQNLPWTFSHGDLLPSNVMVYSESGNISGLLDWAEGEYLPFGIGMYGLEELLGEDQDGHFVYYSEAKHLRGLFWSELFAAAPEIARDSRRIALVKRAQIFGILLWHGIAFDDGRLDRVVEEGKDDAEIERLDAFLLSSPAIRIIRRRGIKVPLPLSATMIRKSWLGKLLASQL